MELDEINLNCNNSKWNFSDFMAKGLQGSVFVVTSNDDDNMYVGKIFSSEREYKIELLFLTYLNYFNVSYVPKIYDNYECILNSEKNYVIISEYVGDTMKVMKQFLDREIIIEKYKIVKEILEDLYKKYGVIHSDTHYENITIDENDNDNVKLIDFYSSISKYFLEKDTIYSKKFKELVEQFNIELDQDILYTINGFTYGNATQDLARYGLIDSYDESIIYKLDFEGGKSRKMSQKRKSRKSRKTRKTRKSRKSRKTRKTRKSRKMSQKRKQRKSKKVSQKIK